MRIGIEYKVEMTLGVLGGTILFLVGAIGSAQSYLALIELGRTYILPENIAGLLANIFITLASLGGLTVIAGSIFIGIRRRKIGNWFVGMGAGISLSTLLIKIYLLGPVIANLIKEAKVAEALGIFGIEVGLVGLGVMLSFLSTLTNYRWMIYMFLLSILNMYIGVTTDPLIIELLVIKLKLSEQVLFYIYHLESLVTYIGLLYLVIMLIVGANNFRLSKLLALISLASLLPSEVLMVITTISLIQDLTLLENTRLIFHTINLIAIIFFVIKAKPVHVEKSKTKRKQQILYEIGDQLVDF